MILIFQICIYCNLQGPTSITIRIKTSNEKFLKTETYFEKYVNNKASDVREKYVRDQGMFGTNCKFAFSGNHFVTNILDGHLSISLSGNESS